MCGVKGISGCGQAGLFWRGLSGCVLEISGCVLDMGVQNTREVTGVCP